MTRTAIPIGLLIALGLSVGACASAGTSNQATPDDAAPESDAPRVVQPGAPGQPSRVVEAGNVSELDMPGWTEADADFMRGMIHHHAQALQMTALIPERSISPGVHQMGLRMEISQRDEIRLMQNWLRTRGLDAPEVVLTPGPMQGRMDHDMAAMDDMTHAGMAGMERMPGMLSPDQMTDLRNATGDEFDRLFLEYMIQHHTGALLMVDELFEHPGAGQESEVFLFATDVDADQRAEIDRMSQLLAQYR